MDPPHLNFVDHHSLLAINPSGAIRRLYVPFRVQVIQETKVFHSGSWVWVEEVMQHKQYLLLYRVGDHWWPYFVFKLSINF